MRTTAGAGQEAGELQTFGYVMGGGGTLAIGKSKVKVSAGWYFYAPAGQSWSFTGVKPGTQLTLFQKKYVPLAGVASRFRSSQTRRKSRARPSSAIRPPTCRCCCPTTPLSTSRSIFSPTSPAATCRSSRCT
ncbi:MAG: hypothetical protein WDM96_10845 [Lacunisphaera sp.]